jgi:glycosyltransferase involved in cell wall biosynthesis
MTGVPVLLIGNFLSGANGSRGVCEELAARLTARGWPVLTASAKPARLPRLWDMVRTVVRRRGEYVVANVDVFSGPAFVWSEAVCAALRRCGKPYGLTLHGGNLPDFAGRRPRRVRRLLQSARVVTTPSRYLQEQMAAYRADLQLLPNAVELDRCRFRLRSAARPSLVWLRAFHEIYNPTLAVQVVRLLAAEFPDVQLTMVGPDKGDGSRQQVAQAAAGLDGKLVFPGPVPKTAVPDWLNRGDVFLNTTNVDNAPVSVLEAMACGLCVVSTNVGGLPYLLRDGHDALLVPPNDAPAMASAVRRLLREPALAEQLSREGRATAERYDWALVLPQWETLLASLAIH